MKTLNARRQTDSPASDALDDSLPDHRELNPPAEKALARADAFYKAGNLTAACDSLQQALQHAPANLSLRVCLGNIQLVMYFDDVNDMITLNSWCGEALAVREFNRSHRYRKIEEKWTRQNTCNAGWHDQMYCCHVLDHPVRSGKLKCTSLDLNVTIY